MTGFVASASASDLTGHACVGFRGGGALFTGGLNYDRAKPPDPNTGEIGLYEHSVRPRLAGDLVFGYAWSDHLTLEMWTSWAWSRFKSDAPGAADSFYVATSVPALLGVRYLAMDGRPWRPFAGVGGGIYWWSVLSRDLGAAKDPATFVGLRKGVPGVYGNVGVEHRLSKFITGTGDVVYHYLFSEDLKDYPSGFNGNKSYVQVRLGVNFYFSVSERIESGFPE
jgi:hypothetical protein